MKYKRERFKMVSFLLTCILAAGMAFIIAVSIMIAIPLKNTYARSEGGVEDVVSYIIFSNRQLSAENGTVIEEGDEIIFKTTRYKFEIDWAVDYNGLSAAGITLSAGDYFTFELPDIFRNSSFNLTVGGVVWATVEVDKNGNGKVIFTDKIEGLTDVKGSLVFESVYSETTQGKPVDWSFNFGDDTYKYTGTAEGGGYDNAIYDDLNFKDGVTAGDNYRWRILLNTDQEAWKGRITLTDTLGSSQKLTTCFGSMDTRQYGYYGDTGYEQHNNLGSQSSAYYFEIMLVDWNKMREDYNAIIRQNIAENHSTIYYTDSAGNYVDSGYVVTPEITHGYSSFMWGRMLNLRYSGQYLYTEPYTGGFEAAAVDEDSFTLIFPDGALDGKSVYMHCYTELTSPITPQYLYNNATISGEDPGEDIEYNIEGQAYVYGNGTIGGTSGKITLFKYDSSGIHPLSGAGFSLKKEPNGPIIIGTTDNDGLITFVLDDTGGYSGTYTLTETIAPDGYTPLSSGITIVLNSGGEITKVNDTNILPGTGDAAKVKGSDGKDLCMVSSDRLMLLIYNEKAPETGGFKMTKVDSVNESVTLPDAEFKLYYWNNSTKYYYALDNNDNITWTEDADAAEILITNALGELSVAGLPYDTYYLEEIKAPPGYEIEIDITEIIINATTTEELTITNKKKVSGDFIFCKVDASNAEQWLPGAQFKLYRWEGPGEVPNELVPKDLTGSGWTYIDMCVSDNESGRVVFESLPPGTYQLVETIAPGGYQLPMGQWRFAVNNDGTITILPCIGDNKPPAIKNNDMDDIPYLIGNMPQYRLPETGGGRNTWYTVIGILMLVNSVLLTKVYIERKKEK